MKRILAIGNALVDVLIKIDKDHLLSELDLVKGGMTLVDKDKIQDILGKTRSLEKKRTAGGSAANTIYGLAQLGIYGGFMGKIGNDETGHFFNKDMEKNSVKTHLFTGKEETGRVIVFVSSDLERTFAVYLGSSIELDARDLNIGLFKEYDHFFLEGYQVRDRRMSEKALILAREAKNEVSMDLSSFSIIEENRDFIEYIVERYVDIVFANEHEAAIFTGKDNPEAALNEMSKICQIAIVKRGEKGSLIKENNKLHRIDPTQIIPSDTTGAGDLYAAGFFYGMAKGFPLHTCGEIASVVGGKVVEVIGSRMDETKWVEIRTRISQIESGAMV